MRSLNRLSAVALVSVGSLLPMTAASAADSVTRSGSCSATSSWTMTAAEAQGDVAALRLTVNSSTAGQTWRVTLSRQGAQFFSTQVRANNQGDFTVTRNAREQNGVNDSYTARATSPRGEVCSAQVALPD
jgi:hypothetical protein